jgi:hypothetical protein
MMSIVVVTWKSSTSKVRRIPNPHQHPPGPCPPFITPCCESVIASGA